MKLNLDQKRMLAGKIVQHLTDMITEDDLAVGAVAGGVFRDSPEAERAYLEGVTISEERHSASIGVASRLLGFDRDLAWEVVHRCTLEGIDPVEVILARSK